MSKRAVAPIVAIHGAGMSASAWSTIDIDRLTAIDLPGHGLNTSPALSSIDAMAEWVAAELDRGGDTPAHLAGHSMGTFVALALAAERPDLVASLTLCATAASMPVHPDLLASAEDDAATAAGLMAKWGHSRSARDRELLVAASAAVIASCAPGVLAADLAACAAYDTAAASAAVDVPVTIVIGTDDVMTPPTSAEELAAAFATPPTIVTLADVGHMMLAEAPSRITTTLSQVL